MSRMNQAMTDLLRYDAALLPSVRSTFDKSHSHTTTFDSGALIPLMADRVLPGDEKKIFFSAVTRMATPIHPVMDQAIFDVWCFYVPDRLWYAHAKEFYGENKDAEFNPDGEYIMPYLKPSQYCVHDEYHPELGIGSLNDYFGFPVMSTSDGIDRDSDSRNYVSAGLHRCYQLIWNDWFRNSSIQPSLQLNDGDLVTNAEWEVIRKLRYVNRYPDYFTTALKDPQSGPDVLLPISDYVPVVPRSTLVSDDEFNSSSLMFRDSDGDTSIDALLIADDGRLYPDFDSPINPATDVPLSPANLWAHLTDAGISTITNLRAAITAQHLFELRNSAGKRYQQILQATWGVLTGDATLQRPQLIGTTGKNYLGMRQVVQTSETSGDSPLGNVAAFSLTDVTNKMICNQAFTEPGILMIVGAIRPVTSYGGQGINSLWTQISPFEQFQPVFDGLSNQPIYNYELFASHGANPDDLHKVFGYKPAWDEYRTMQNRVSGYMRPDVTGTLSSWNYSIKFDTQPLLDDAFVQVDPDLMDRVIATPDEPQFICDCYFSYHDTRSMSVHGTPGIDMI